MRWSWRLTNGFKTGYSSPYGCRLLCFSAVVKRFSPESTIFHPISPRLGPTLQCDEQLQTISRENYGDEVFFRWWSLRQLCHWRLWFPCHWTIDFVMKINDDVAETTANARFRIVWCFGRRIWNPRITSLRRIDELVQEKKRRNSVREYVVNIGLFWSFIIAKNDILIKMGMNLKKENNS